MDEQQFWLMVQQTHESSGGDMERKCEILKELISKLGKDDALRFAHYFDAMMDRAYSWSLWGAACVINGGCSDDCFADFRATLISYGQQLFELVLADPGFLASDDFDEIDWFFEGIQYAVHDGVKAATGGADYQREKPYPLQPSGMAWAEEGVYGLFPKLSQKFALPSSHTKSTVKIPAGKIKRYLARLKIWLFIIALIVGCVLIARYVAPLLDVNIKTALLFTMVAAYLLLSIGVEIVRYRLRKSMENLPEAVRVATGQFDPELRYAVPTKGSASPRGTVWLGAILINGMVIPLMIGPMALLQQVFQIREPLPSALSLLLGFCLAWIWWSVGVTVWRWWATTHQGMPADEVQWRGENASMLWPRGHFFEKTEFGKLFNWRQ
ncbi:MAG: DUF4240 domain-containing protein [Methylococcaceae bacterium]|nr:DUF4240 domain-containing protein [Methylococcaceae bacterium]